jgi:WD40 repeat protein
MKSAQEQLIVMALFRGTKYSSQRTVIWTSLRRINDYDLLKRISIKFARKLVFPHPLPVSIVQRDSLIVGGEFDAAEVDREIISQRLQQDIAESKGKVYKHLATTLVLNKSAIKLLIATKNPVTCVAESNKTVFLGCKNGIIEKWDIDGKPVRTGLVRRVKGKRAFGGHADDVLCMALGGNGKVVATGGRDKRICVWETETMRLLKTFTQHRGSVLVSPLPHLCSMNLSPFP